MLVYVTLMALGLGVGAGRLWLLVTVLVSLLVGSYASIDYCNRLWMWVAAIAEPRIAGNMRPAAVRCLYQTGCAMVGFLA